MRPRILPDPGSAYGSPFSSHKAMNCRPRPRWSASLTRDDFGLWLFVAATAIVIIVALLVTYVYPIEWFRERLLSEDRWTRAAGTLPIAFPVYIVAGLVFSYFRH